MKIFFKATFIREKPVFSTELQPPDYFQLKKINYDPVPVLSPSLLKDILDRFPFIPSTPNHHAALEYSYLQLKLLSGKNFLSRMKRFEEDFFRIKRQEARENASAFKTLQTEFLREIKIELDTLRIIDEECLKSNFHFKQAFLERREITKKHFENHLKALDQSANWFDKKLDELENEHRTELARRLKNQNLPGSSESIPTSSKTSIIAVLEGFPSTEATKLGIALQKIYRHLVHDFDHFRPTQKYLLRKSELHFDKPASQQELFQREIFDQRLWKQLSHISEALQKTSSGQIHDPGALGLHPRLAKNDSSSSFLELLEKSTRLQVQLEPPNLLKNAKVLEGLRAFSLVKSHDQSVYLNPTTNSPESSSKLPTSIFGAISKVTFDVQKEAAFISVPREKWNPLLKWSGAASAPFDESSYLWSEESERLIKKLEDERSAFAERFQIEESAPQAFTTYGPKTASAPAAKEVTQTGSSNHLLEKPNQESREGEKEKDKDKDKEKVDPDLLDSSITAPQESKAFAFAKKTA